MIVDQLLTGIHVRVRSAERSTQISVFVLDPACRRPEPVIEPDATEIAILHSGPVIRNRTKLRHSRTHQPFVRRKLFECPEPAAGRDESHQIAWLDLLLYKALEREDNGRWIAEAL